MAKQIARILKTNMMTDINVPALAQFLQGMGRSKDKVLAHINKEEAALLKRRGGSGTRNPATGLLEFQNEDFGAYDEFNEPINQENEPEVNVSDTEVTQPFAVSDGEPIPQFGVAEMPPAVAPVAEPSQEIPGTVYKGIDYAGTETAFAPPGAGGGALPEPPPEEDKNWYEKLSTQDKIRLGLGLGTSALTALIGQKGIKQAREVAQATKEVGKPYSELGKQLQASALRGELTPAGQRSIEAARAQIAQAGARGRSVVSSQQAAVQLANLRQNLLEQQFTYGLKVAQIGDQYVSRAISQGLTGDREMTQLMAGLTGAIGNLFGSIPTAKPENTTITTTAV